MDGFLNINKPAGWTSHDVVARLRSLLKVKKVGHTGTLDPAATGVLPICLGKATKLARLRRALDALGDLVVPEDRLLFFEQHHPLLLKMRPIDLLDTEQGTAAVMRLIEGLESGAFA